MLPAIVLEPYDTWARGIAPVIAEAHQHHVKITVAIHVSHRRRVRAAEIGNLFGLKFPITKISKPQAAVIRLRPGVRIFQIVSLWHQQVEFAVLVQITHAVSYTHLRAHETPEHLVCRLL